MVKNVAEVVNLPSSADKICSTLPANVTTALEINLSSVAHNFHYLSGLLSKATCSAVVKANAYGFGATQVASVLSKNGCKEFYVATIDEGIHLRQVLPDAFIGVFNGLLPGTESYFEEHNLIPVLNDLGQLTAWQNRAKRVEENLPAIVHVDTGMWRLGLPPQESKILLEQQERLNGLDIKYIMSHLAVSDQPSHEKNQRQWHSFKNILEALPQARASLANSNGIFLGPQYHFDQVRPGRSLYGLGSCDTSAEGLQRVLRLYSKVVQVRDVEVGETIGYDASYMVQRPTRLATISIGYADGLLSTLGNRGVLHIDEVPAPIVGRVSMDLITIDVTNVPEFRIQPGSWVEVFGPHLSADSVALAAGTTSRELMVHLGQRLHKTYIYNEEQI